MQEQIKCVHVLNILGLDLQQRLCMCVFVCDGTGGGEESLNFWQTRKKRREDEEVKVKINLSSSSPPRLLLPEATGARRRRQHKEIKPHQGFLLLL